MQTRRRSLLAKSLLLHGPRTFNWHEDMLPLMGDNDVVIETIAGAVRVGEEVSLYMGDDSDPPLQYPLMSGNESYGRITGVGKNVPEQFIGEKIVATYGHCTHAILPVSELIFAPSRVPPPTALLAISTCPIANAIQKLTIQPDERVLITGAGAVGLMTIWMLRHYGVSSIHLLETAEDRREKALKLGATVAVHPAEARRWADDFDVGIDCSNQDAGFAFLQSKMRPGGRMCLLTDGEFEPLTLSSHFREKQLSLIASHDPRDYHKHAIWFWRLVEDDHSLAEALFDVTVPHMELPVTIGKIAKGIINPIKVLVNYQVEIW